MLRKYLTYFINVDLFGRYDMLELPEECPDYDYGLKVRSKEQQATVDSAVAGIHYVSCSFSLGQQLLFCFHFSTFLPVLSMVHISVVNDIFSTLPPPPPFRK
jgi:hypothetical protein